MKNKLIVFVLFVLIVCSSFSNKATINKSPSCGSWIWVTNNTSKVINSINVYTNLGTTLNTDINLQPSQSFYLGQFSNSVTNFRVRLVINGAPSYTGSATLSHDGGSDIFCQNDNSLMDVEFLDEGCEAYRITASDGACGLN